MFISMIALVFFCLFQLSTAFEEISSEVVSLTFEDNLIERKFSTFAKVNLRLSRQSKVDLIPQRTVSSAIVQQWIDENSREFYTLKLHYKRNSIMTSVPMCLILQAQLEYLLTLFLNENGFIISAHLMTKNSTCDRTNLSALIDKSELNYRVVVQFQSNEIGPQPETQYFLEKLKLEQEAKLHAQENDSRPFILKYWKYLLPVAVVFILQSVFTDPGGR